MNYENESRKFQSFGPTKDYSIGTMAYYIFSVAHEFFRKEKNTNFGQKKRLIIIPI